MNLNRMLNKLPVMLLKSLCHEHGLPNGGSKATQVERLEDALGEDVDSIIELLYRHQLKDLLDRRWGDEEGCPFRFFGFSKATRPQLADAARAFFSGQVPRADGVPPWGPPLSVVMQVVPGKPKLVTPPPEAPPSKNAVPQPKSSKGRHIPATRYSDVHGQDAALEAVRDLVELPLRHADLFTRLGATAPARGLILAGPPGTGKSLLARAVAGECGAHVEVISGPALVSKWIGDTEAAIRTVFARAKAMAPAIILFDELDCIAPARGQADHQHDISMVSQLLVLLDGLEGRGQVFMLGTTNRPEDIDPALRRPGRFDQTVTLGLPDLAGRRATFHHYLKPLTLTRGLSPKDLAADLAARTQGVSGADIQFICQQAVCLCVKQGLASGTSPDKLALSVDHFHRAAQAQRGATHSVASPLHGSNCKCI